MGSTHSDYYEGETHTIQGKVMGALENAKVTLYLDDKSEPIAKADVQNDGSYVLEFTPEVHENIVKSKYALLSSDGTQKSLKSIVTFYDSNSSKGYSYKDTIISGYTDAVYKIKSSLLFDKNTSKQLVKKFMPLYSEGKYDSKVANAYAFAYNGVMDELAEHNEYDKNATFKALKKLATLNKEEVAKAKENKANKYAFLVTKQIDANIIVQEVTFDISTNLSLIEDGTTYSLEKTVVGKNEFYDSAAHYKFELDSETELKAVKVDTFDSNKSQTKFRKATEIVTLKGNSKTFIIENLRLPLKGLNEENSSKFFKTNIPVRFNAFTHKLYDGLFFTTEQWEYLGSQHVSSINSNINFKGLFDYKNYYKDRHRAVLVQYFDNQNTFIYNRYYFNDEDNVYANATVASRILRETSNHKDGNLDNNFANIYEKSTWGETYELTPSHSIIDFDKIVTKDFAGGRTLAWQNSLYAKHVGSWWATHEAEDTRKPLLLIHGWQALKKHAERNPAILRDYEHNEFEYWHNFLSYYLTTPDLYTRYKIYTYHYPSYKHITYNGRILQELFRDLRNTNTVIGRKLNEYNGLTIIGHSMGGLVARSMIEEYNAMGFDAQGLAKLITLDTPHHGSQGAVRAHFAAGASEFFRLKDLSTAGSVDLMWDNYDSYYLPSSEQQEIFSRTLNRNDPRSRYKLLGDGNRFDNHYLFTKLASLRAVYQRDQMNPYLAYLNQNFRNNWKAVAQSDGGKKYIFYVAHSSSDQTFGNRISNPIDTSKAYRATTWTFNGFGYGSGGAAPVCGSFLSWANKDNIDDITRFDGSFTLPHKFIKIENKGDPINDNIAYRYFWDYDHQSIMAGRAKGNGAWDAFIDNTERLTLVNDCNYSTYNNLEIGWEDSDPEDSDYVLQCRTQHFNYYKFASRFKDGIPWEIDMNELNKELSNPLISEPVFMILHKDLMNIWEGK